MTQTTISDEARELANKLLKAEADCQEAISLVYAKIIQQALSRRDAVVPDVEEAEIYGKGFRDGVALITKGDAG